MKILHVIFYHLLLWSGFSTVLTLSNGDKLHYKVILFFRIPVFSLCNSIFCITRKKASFISYMFELYTIFNHIIYFLN